MGLALGLAALLSLAAACSSGTSNSGDKAAAGEAAPNAAETAAPTAAPVVSVEKIAAVELADEISYPGRVVSKVNAVVNADVDGIVQKVVVPLGQRVGAQSTLFLIKNTDPVYEYVPVKVASPVGGVVSSIDVAEGSMVKRGQQLATVTDPRQLRVQVEVSAADLSKIEPAMHGTFTLGGHAGRVVDVTVAGVSPLVDLATGTATTELKPDAKATDLPVGLIGRVVFKVNRRQGLQVPEAALVYRGEATFLRLVDQAKKVKFVPVTISATRRGLAEIATGLKAGDVVVVSTSSFVADGQAVTVQESDVAKK